MWHSNCRRAGHLGVILNFYILRKDIFCIFYEVNLTGRSYFDSSGSEIANLYNEFGLEATFGTSLWTRKPQMPSSDIKYIQTYQRRFALAGTASIVVRAL